MGSTQRGFFLVVLSAIAVIISLLPRTAKAICYTTITIRFHCPAQNCDETIGMDVCPQGKQGGYCITGWGLCCGIQYSSTSASGNCQCNGYPGCQRRRLPSETEFLAQDELVLPDVPETKSEGKALRSATSERDSSPRRLILSRVVYLPDRCSHSYGIVFPN